MLSEAGAFGAAGELTEIVYHGQLLPVTDLTQLSARRINQADLVIYAYKNTNDEQQPSSIDYLVSIRESAAQKLLDLPSLIVGVASEKAEKGNPTEDSLSVPATRKALDFCSAAGLGAPLVLSSPEPLHAELLRRATTR